MIGVKFELRVAEMLFKIYPKLYHNVLVIENGKNVLYTDLHKFIKLLPKDFTGPG